MFNLLNNYILIRGKVTCVDRYYLYSNMNHLNLKNKASFLYVLKISAQHPHGSILQYNYFERSFFSPSWKKDQQIEVYVSRRKLNYNIKEIASGAPLFSSENGDMPLVNESGFVLDWPVEASRVYKYRYEIFLDFITGIISLGVMLLTFLIIPLIILIVLIF
jgi:hypothetical protein